MVIYTVLVFCKKIHIFRLFAKVTYVFMLWPNIINRRRLSIPMHWMSWLLFQICQPSKCETYMDSGIFMFTWLTQLIEKSPHHYVEQSTSIYCLVKRTNVRNCNSPNHHHHQWEAFHIVVYTFAVIKYE